MGLGIGAMLSQAGSIRAGYTDIQRIARRKANPCPLASGLGIDHLDLDIEIIGFLDVSHSDFIVAVPFFSTTIQDVEPGVAYRYNLPGPDRHARLRPFDR